MVSIVHTTFFVFYHVCVLLAVSLSNYRPARRNERGHTLLGQYTHNAWVASLPRTRRDVLQGPVELSRTCSYWCKLRYVLVASTRSTKTSVIQDVSWSIRRHVYSSSKLTDLQRVKQFMIIQAEAKGTHSEDVERFWTAYVYVNSHVNTVPLYIELLSSSLRVKIIQRQIWSADERMLLEVTWFLTTALWKAQEEWDPL